MLFFVMVEERRESCCSAKGGKKTSTLSSCSLSRRPLPSSLSSFDTSPCFDLSPTLSLHDVVLVHGSALRRCSPWRQRRSVDAQGRATRSPIIADATPPLACCHASGGSRCIGRALPGKRRRLWLIFLLSSNVSRPRYSHQNGNQANQTPQRRKTRVARSRHEIAACVFEKNSTSSFSLSLSVVHHALSFPAVQRHRAVCVARSGSQQRRRIH